MFDKLFESLQCAYLKHLDFFLYCSKDKLELGIIPKEDCVLQTVSNDINHSNHYK